ncbi:hypothetical protein HNR03_000636 [Pseudomonas sp. JAI111]|jgi:hypothetical protein|nr:hypothetical protein [Pseudomonas sp. JAI111]
MSLQVGRRIGRTTGPGLWGQKLKNAATRFAMGK